MNIDKMEIRTWSGEREGEIEAPEFFFDEINYDLIQKRIKIETGNRKYYQATKCIGDVSGSTRKRHNQKGGGRARAGSGKDAQWRGGGIIFGPHPREVNLKLNKKMMKLALRSLLSMKYQAQECQVFGNVNLPSYKTQGLVNHLSNLQMNEQKVLFIVGDEENAVNEASKNFQLAARNIHFVNTLPTSGINAMSIMNCKYVIFTTKALEQLKERLAN